MPGIYDLPLVSSDTPQPSITIRQTLDISDACKTVPGPPQN